MLERVTDKYRDTTTLWLANEINGAVMEFSGCYK